MSAATSVSERLRAAIEPLSAELAGRRVVVAVSGGLDSCVLLHLLRFGPPPRPELIVAHYDHAMREDSAADALWVRGLCASWGIAFRPERAERRPGSESAARAARYDFLERVRRREGADRVLTAHHADDQAETVLFRVLRGTGIGGLAGIPRRREESIERPLIDFWKEELVTYAERVGLSWREDATNAELSYARNVIRHRILPDAEAFVAPGARRALVRLAGIARAEEEAWDGLLEVLFGQLEVTPGDGEIALRRARLLGLPPAVRARVLRALVARLGTTLDERGTRLAMQFSSSGRSGGALDLGGGVELRRRLDRLVVLRPCAPPPDRTLTISDVGPGSGSVRLSGLDIDVAWGARPSEGGGARSVELSADRLPLVIRARAPGDRIRLPGGTKKVKKLLLEARIPADRRGQVPIVVDATGSVLWVPGVTPPVREPSDRRTLTLTIGIGR